MIRANFHTHTKVSFDGYNSYKAIYENAKRVNLDVIAITDHDEIRGAYEMQNWLKSNKKHDLEVIIGEEVTCTDGTHIIGLFIEELIPTASPIEVITNIKTQGGMVYFPHPTRKDGICSSKYADEALKQGDFYEIFNAKIDPSYNQKATELFKEGSLTPLGGSDAHYNSDIRKCVCRFENTGRDVKTMLLNHKQHNNIAIEGKLKLSKTGNNYFPLYYKYKEKINLPIWIRGLGKVIFPLYKNYKERNNKIQLTEIYNTLDGID